MIMGLNDRSRLDILEMRLFWIESATDLLAERPHRTSQQLYVFPLPSLSLLPLPPLKVARALLAPLSLSSGGLAGWSDGEREGRPPYIACSCSVCGHVSKLGFFACRSEWCSRSRSDLENRASLLLPLASMVEADGFCEWSHS
jgi:hypothetical protein